MKEVEIQTQERSQFLDITAAVREAVQESGIRDGRATVFVPHTTAGITINENADPDVVRDMLSVLDELVPWRGNYRHAEGNTAAHVKSSLMGSSAAVLVSAGRLQLGVWQSIWFCEFDGPRTRKVLIEIHKG
ncbi:MAG TPA: secondary thiamine-phosphate synthase enzyme YjbQ [Kiritimatiellia bacterium]|nr:secondary thiamine-phosphate synthase enzyme YjbQ [Kiritimatiellia bacterium]HNR94598.1 secondary thiamine-phosphate synthase enzyme YjbQ [Kiritimatiellia bacterium]HNS81693.1 secondary thiamine-phosphate synthase enzyme YjbQ [Kiritimatiellia bacterium]HPA78408.1 secondary thiamine-phosphate synthase enzyme YjbQ [Kiritimatiellia bacterium]HQQ04666.1 secondary thiamine-phosphate synthase enzyme YjbQ [Kiritimatiellia bacterium]